MKIDNIVDKYITEMEELDRKWHRLLLKHGFKEIKPKREGAASYQKGDYIINVSFESSPGINRWGSYNKDTHMFGGTSINSLRDYISGKGKRSMGDESEKKRLKR